MERRSYFSCSVFGCLNTTKNCDYAFFNFPNDIDRRDLWLNLVDREDVKNKWSTFLRVCEAHFETNCLRRTSKRTMLRKGSIPTLLLPAKKHDNKEIQATVETTESCTQHERLQRDYNTQTPVYMSAGLCRRKTCKLLDRKKRIITITNQHDLNRGDEMNHDDDDLTDDATTDNKILYANKTWLKTDKDQPDATSGGKKLFQIPTGITCKECRTTICGFRLKCVECADFEMCSACGARGKHPGHYFLRIPPSKLKEEADRMVKVLRVELELETPMEEQAQIKVEIKGEIPDPLEQPVPAPNFGEEAKDPQPSSSRCSKSSTLQVPVSKEKPSVEYCRLCAASYGNGKLRLINLQSDDVIKDLVVNMTKRLNTNIDFSQERLPTTTCSTCIKALYTAYDFVVGIDLAQTTLSNMTMQKYSDQLTEKRNIDSTMDSSSKSSLQEPPDPMRPHEGNVMEQSFITLDASAVFAKGDDITTPQSGVRQGVLSPTEVPVVVPSPSPLTGVAQASRVPISMNGSRGTPKQISKLKSVKPQSGAEKRCAPISSPAPVKRLTTNHTATLMPSTLAHASGLDTVMSTDHIKIEDVEFEVKPVHASDLDTVMPTDEINISAHESGLYTVMLNDHIKTENVEFEVTSAHASDLETVMPTDQIKAKSEVVEFDVFSCDSHTATTTTICSKEENVTGPVPVYFQ